MSNIVTDWLDTAHLTKTNQQIMRFIDASYSIKLSGQGLCKGEHYAGLDKKEWPGTCDQKG